jgi:NAD(P)-dependent dehydrogenase (short-subunit alcohol dehydrogenase family)
MNLLSALWVTQAALPYLREQGSGHIVQVSISAGGSVTSHVAASRNRASWASRGA